MLIQNDVKWKKWAMSALLCVAVMLTQQVILLAQTDFDCATITDGMPQSECEALVALYNATDGENWVYANGNSSGDAWLQTTTPCVWYGVSCDGTRSVKELDLSNKGIGSVGLSGVLPDEIGQLTYLIILNLDVNNITAISPQIGNLPLITLDLNSNRLTELPPELGNISSLRSLQVRGNLLAELPAELGNLSTLNLLDVRANQLTDIPIEVWSLPSLFTLYVNGNPQLTGEVPESLVNKWFTQLYFSETGLCEPATDAFQTWYHGLQYTLGTDVHCTNVTFDCTTITDGMPQTECEALVAIYNALYGQGWTYDMNSTSAGHEWLTTSTPCFWYGIICDPNDSVQYISLNNMGLMGSLPEEIGQFPKLEGLTLASNQIAHIHPNINGLIAMTSLALNNNVLRTLPPEIGDLPNLEWVGLAENRLGVLPDEIGNLPKLKNLHLNGNSELQGALPLTFLGDDIDSILYDDTQLCEPADEAYQTWLSTVSHEGGIGTCSEFSGCAGVTEIPVSECEALVAFYNSTNGDSWSELSSEGWLQTNTPCSWGGVICSNNVVVQLEKSNQDLSGVIPVEIGNLTNLTRLWVHGNRLTEVPAEIGNLTNLVQLYIHANFLTEIPAEIGNLTNLDRLGLSDNQLTTIPAEIWDLTNLISLRLHGNRFTTLPAEIGNLINLTQMPLFQNQLTSVPAEIGNLTNLADLWLADNQLTTIPDEIWGLTNLTSLSLHNNQLTTLPADLLELTNLNDLEYDEGVCVTAEPADVEVWSSMTGLTIPSCSSNLPKTDLLGVYLLSMDNASENSNNLTPRYGETIQSLTVATEGVSDKTAVVLADLERDGDTHILIINDGAITSIVGLPDGNGTLDIGLTEYDMTDGAQLGGFLKWALANYGGEQVSTVVSFVGHGSFLVPDVSLDGIGMESSSTRSRALDPGVPLPFRVDISADYTDVHPHKRLITPYALQQMLEIGTADSQPITVLDLSHCFAASIEQFYEVAGESGRAESVIGSPNYAYFAPDMLGEALRVVSAEDDSATMSSRIVETYDTLLTTYDGADGDPETTEHPRSLVAVSSAGLSAVKTAMDQLSGALIQAFDTNGAETQQLLAAAHRNTTQFYDTTYCVSDWTLTHEDALVDIGAFMAQVESVFDGDVANRAADVQAAVNSAIITATSANGTPWFSNGDQQWVMDGANVAGLSLYADLYGLATADVPNERTLSWHAAYYDKAITADNPHPFAFISGATTWSDVFGRYWQETASEISLQDAVVCFPTFAPVQEVIALDARGGIKDIALDWQVEHPLDGVLAQYNVYKYEVGSSPVLLTSQAGARYVDQNTFTSGEDYCYYVEAVDESGGVIGTSNTDCERFGELQLVVPHQVMPPSAEGVSLPISIVNGNGLCPTGIDMLIEYDPTILAVTGVSNTMYAENYVFDSNLLQPGQVNIASVSGLCEPLAGRGSLFEMQFDVIGAQGDISPINFVHGITATAIFDEGNVSTPVDVRLVDGSISVSADFVRGDVNGDGAISAIDAYLALQIASGEWIPTLIQDASCDVNGDGVCNSADSSLILCYAANENWSSCGLSPTATTRSAQSKTSIEITQVEITERNTEGYLPVNLSSPNGIAGGALTFTYEPTHLTLNGVHLDGTLLTDVTITADEVTGLLRVAFADDVTIGTNGTLIYLDVTPRFAGATVQLAGAQFNDAAGLDWETNLGNDITLLTQTYNIPLAVQSQQQTASVASMFILLATIVLLTWATVGSIQRLGESRL